MVVIKVVYSVLLQKYWNSIEEVAISVGFVLINFSSSLKVVMKGVFGGLKVVLN